ncbi:ABC transporter ATP-binding protein [Gemmobacter sp.]|uniref:ABC transporter ATP-binding protein n=1 Tax=Gemmobacter sp. TaxID=1898957 RepID=UPI002AFDCE4B|nr:ATP-binding cassette domain-containing protein [Gemmobacter sp.]
MSLLALDGIGHAFFGRTVLDGITLDVGRGEVVSLLGPSGSGKSTVAHIAAGLIEPSEGRVSRAYARHAMVFQEPRLMPWATVAQNIGFPLRLARSPRRGRAAQIEAAAGRAGLLPEDLPKFPVELSGGMRQRTAIARALVADPDFLYFDEPFTALDVALKRRMQDLVIAAAAEGRFGALFITHDLMEAIRISHRILVLDRHGRGIAGARGIAGQPGDRSDQACFDLRQRFLGHDPLFAHIHDIDERQRP